MVNGLTPILDYKIQTGNCLFYVHYRSGNMMSRAGDYSPIVITGNPVINRKGGSDYSTTSGYYRYDGFAVPATALTIIARGRKARDAGFFINDGSLIIGHDSANNRMTATNNNSTQAVSATNSFYKGETHTIAVTRTVAAPSLINHYIDGVLSGTADQSGGNITAGGAPQFLMYEAGSQEFVAVFSGVLSVAEIAALGLEMTQINFETNAMIQGLNSWVARCGIIADEKTYSAGQSLGGVNSLIVSTGTYKVTSVLYNGKRAKAVECVTNGNILLPNPENLTTYTYYYKKYTGSWADATSATNTITLTAGQRILWATEDNNECLYMVK